MARKDTIHGVPRPKLPEGEKRKPTHLTFDPELLAMMKAAAESHRLSLARFIEECFLHAADEDKSILNVELVKEAVRKMREG